MTYKYFCLSKAILILLLPLFITNSYGIQNKSLKEKAVRIGLLVQDKESLSAAEGAGLAVKLSNRSGGLSGMPFELVVRSMEGPWGTGSKQAVDLIFEEKVWALLGSHDGRNAHLVEQAATKSQVVFISAWSSDPSLSHAFVPWFYNCVPTDLRQADALIDEIYEKRKTKEVIIVHDGDYDSKQSLNSFIREIKIRGKTIPEQFNYDNSGTTIKMLSEKLRNSDSGILILFCRPSVSYNLYSQIRHEKINNPVFGSLHLLDEDNLNEQQLKDYDNDLLIPSGKWSQSESLMFVNEYKKEYGKVPGMVAAYAFDATNLLIKAIKIAGSDDREKIQKALTSIKYIGVTGTIQFDQWGNRTDKVEIQHLENGVPSYR
jgi:branched-chain amino acid transport system substrate-binding protein